MSVALWPREAFAPTGDKAEVLLWAFAPEPLPEEATLSRSRHGLPEKDPPPAVELRPVSRGSAPEWFEGFFEGALGAIAERDLGARAGDVRATEFCYVVRAEAPDPEDLGYLQACWAIARWLCDEKPGALAVLDGHAARFRPREEILGWPPERPFDVRREVTFVVEPAAPGGGQTLHTRGMRKFGRPDLVRSVPASGDAAREGSLLGAVADHLARGAVLRPGDVLPAPSGLLRVEPYLPGVEVPELHLNNVGLLLAGP